MLWLISPGLMFETPHMLNNKPDKCAKWSYQLFVSKPSRNLVRTLRLTRFCRKWSHVAEVCNVMNYVWNYYFVMTYVVSTARVAGIIIIIYCIVLTYASTRKWHLFNLLAIYELAIVILTISGGSSQAHSLKTGPNRRLNRKKPEPATLAVS
jgi:hypothetical protein